MRQVSAPKGWRNRKLGEVVKARGLKLPSSKCHFVTLVIIVQRKDLVNTRFQTFNFRLFRTLYSKRLSTRVAGRALTSEGREGGQRSRWQAAGQKPLSARVAPGGGRLTGDGSVGFQESHNSTESEAGIRKNPGSTGER